MTLLKNLSAIQKTSLSILFVTALVKIPLVLRDIALAGYFGVNKTMDLFLYALTVPTFLAAIIIASLNYFFIPSYLKIKAAHGPEQARHYITQLFAFALVGTIIFVLLTALPISYFLVKVNLGLFTTSDLIGPFRIFYFLFSIFAGLQIISLILTFLLQAEHRYLSSLFPQALAPATSLLFILLFGKTWGIIAAIYGGLIGMTLGLGILYIAAYRRGIISGLEFNMPRPQIPTDYTTFWVLNFAFLLPALTGLIDQQMAVSLGEGKLSTLTYGLRIPDGIAEILCAGLGTAVFSHFSEWSAQNDRVKLTESLQKVILFSTFLILPITIFLFLYAQPIVSILFERGVFDLSASINVSRTLQFSCFSIYFVVLAIVGVKMIAALRKNYFFLPYSIVLCTLKIVFNIAFIKIWNVNGIALSTIAMLIINCTIVYIFLAKHSIQIWEQSFVVRIIKCLGFVLCFFVVLFTLQTLTIHGTAIWQISMAGIISVLLLGVTARFFLKHNVLINLIK